MPTPTGFHRDSSYSVFEALRPDADLPLKRMAVATYSLDLVAVIALLLSVGRAGEEDLCAGPLDLVDILRTLRSRIRIVHQKGRLKAARKDFGVLHMLDGMLIERPAAPYSSWHPKVILAAYGSAADATHWRLWLGSRNLSGGNDREAGLMLMGRKARPGRVPGEIPGLVPCLRTLFADVQWPTVLWSQLAAVQWAAPDGVRVRQIHFRRQDQVRAFIPEGTATDRVTVISPFVDAAGLEALGAEKCRIQVLTTEATARNLPASEAVDLRIDHSPTYVENILLTAQPDDTGGRPPEVDRPRGLHAKLVLRRSGQGKRKRGMNTLWIGSANVTRRGLLGPNAEVMAELEIPAGMADDIEAVWEAGSQYQVAEPDPEAGAREQAERALDLALVHVLETRFRLDHLPVGAMLVADRSLEKFLVASTLSSWLFTTPQVVREWTPGQDSVRLSDLPVAPARQTCLVGFSARSRQEPLVERRWTQLVEVPGFEPGARDSAAIAAYIGAGRLRQWLRAALSDITPVETEAWTGEERGQGSVDPFATGDAAPALVLEDVLAAWARNPRGFEQRAKEMHDIVRAVEQQSRELPAVERASVQRDLDDIRPFWDALSGLLRRAPDAT